MRLQATLLGISLLTLALAGCADDPLTGTVSFRGSAIPVNGQADFEYTEFEGHTPNNEDEGELCAIDAITGSDPTGTLPTCQEAGTEIRIMLHEASEPNSDGYTAYLVGGDERMLGSLTPDDTGMYILEIGVESENLEGQYNSTEIRMGSLVIYSSATAEGTNAMELASAATGSSFTGEFTDTELTLEVTGLPEGASYEGWLVSEDEETGELIHAVSFPVTNGANTYTASQTLDNYVEVHIHAAGSKVNFGIADINVA